MPVNFGQQSFARPIQTNVGLPIAEVEALGKDLQERFTRNLDQQDQLELLISNLEVRDQNQPVINEALETAKGKLKAIREAGNWEDAGLEVRQAAKDFAMDKNVRAVIKDKEEYDSYLANLKERKDSGDISDPQYMRALALSNSNNTESAVYDEESGTFQNVFSGYNPVKFQDISKAMFDMAEDWKASKGPVPVTYVDKEGKETTSNIRYDAQRQGYINVETDEYVDTAEVQSALRTALKNDERYMAFIDEGIMFDNIERFGKGDKKRPATIADIQALGVKTAPLVDGKESPFSAWLTENGYDAATIESDPDMMEAIYTTLKRNQTIDGFINPAADKAGFVKTTQKYLSDQLMMESLRHRNAVARQANAQAHARNLAAYERKKSNEDYITIANPGVIVNGTKFDSNKLEDSLKQTKGRLAQVERQLETHKTGSGSGDFNKLTQEKALLESQIRVQEVSSIKNFENYLDETKEGREFLTQSTKEYNQALAAQGLPEIDEETMRSELMSGDKEDATIPTFSAFSGIKNALFPESEEVRKSKANYTFNINRQAMMSKVTDFYQDPENGFHGEFTNVLTGEPKSAVGRYNKAVTDHVTDNGTNYWVHGGVSLDDHLNLLQKEAKGKINVEVAMNDDDIEGLFPHYITVTDTDGKRLSQTYLYPKSGGVEEQVGLGARMMQENAPGTANYVRGNHMVANASMPNMLDNIILPQLKDVKDDAIADTPGAFSNVFEAGGYTWTVRKHRKQFWNDKGEPAGVKMVFQAYPMPPSLKGQKVTEELMGIHNPGWLRPYGSTIPVKIDNPAFSDELKELRGKLDKGVNDVERAGIYRKIEERQTFGSYDDLRVSLYNTIKQQ